MMYSDTHAPWRIQKTCAKQSWIKRLWLRLKTLWRQRNHPDVAHLNDRQARDIGLTPADLARQRHQLPSQTSHHPRG